MTHNLDQWNEEMTLCQIETRDGAKWIRTYKEGWRKCRKDHEYDMRYQDAAMLHELIMDMLDDLRQLYYQRILSSPTAADALQLLNTVAFALIPSPNQYTVQQKMPILFVGFEPYSRALIYQALSYISMCLPVIDVLQQRIIILVPGRLKTAYKLLCKLTNQGIQRYEIIEYING